MTISALRFASRDEWMRARRIGSSDVAAVLGVSPYSRPWDVYERLVLGASVSPPTPAQERGVLLEPRVLATYAQRTGRRIRRTPPHTLYTRDGWASATPDALAVDERLIIEAKTDSRRDRWGPEQPIDRWTEDAAGIVRPEYFLQVSHQLWVLDAPAADLAVLVPGDDPLLPELRIYRISRDESVIRRMVARLSEWWERHVVGRVPPAWDDSDAAGRALARVERSGSRWATTYEAALAAQYEFLSRTEKAAKDAKKGLARQLLVTAGSSSRLDLPAGGRVTIVRRSGTPTLDEGALLADHPELAPVLDRYRRAGHPYSYPLVVPKSQR